MNKTRRPRTTTLISEPINHRLSMYALAASAAGVGALAMAQPAQAKIVYTPANIPIQQNGNPVQIDLNHDGINDFSLRSHAYSTHGFRSASLRVVQDQSSNEIGAQMSHHQLFAEAIRKGVRVGPRSPFQKQQAGGLPMWIFASGPTSGGTAFGPWLFTGQRYLGLKFVVNGKTHYGWARVKLDNHRSATLTGYAYETTPNKALVTGKTKGPDSLLAPVSLRHLAQGRN